MAKLMRVIGNYFELIDTESGVFEIHVENHNVLYKIVNVDTIAFFTKSHGIDTIIGNIDGYLLADFVDGDNANAAFADFTALRTSASDKTAFKGGLGVGSREVLKHISWNAQRRRLETDVVFKANVNSFQLGDQHKLTSGNENIFFTNLSTNVNWYPMWGGIKDHSIAGNQAGNGIIAPSGRKYTSDMITSDFGSPVNADDAVTTLYENQYDINPGTGGTSTVGRKFRPTIPLEEGNVVKFYLYRGAIGDVVTDQDTLVYAQLIEILDGGEYPPQAANTDFTFWFDHPDETHDNVRYYTKIGLETSYFSGIEQIIPVVANAANDNYWFEVMYRTFEDRDLDMGFDTTLPDAQPTTNTFGSFDVGTRADAWKGRTFSAIFQDAFFPTVGASSGIAINIDITGFTAGNIEVGTTYGPTVTATLNRGTILNGDGSTAGPTSGLLLDVDFNPPGSALVNRVSAGGAAIVYDLVDFVMLRAAATWVFDATFGAGTGITAYVDNEGNATVDAGITAQQARTTDNTQLIRTGLYNSFRFTGNRGTAPTTSAGVRVLPTQFCSSANTVGYTFVLAAGVEELVIFAPVGSITNFRNNSNNSDLTFNSANINVDDASGATAAVQYTAYTVDFGVGGFPATTNITIS